MHAYILYVSVLATISCLWKTIFLPASFIFKSWLFFNKFHIRSDHQIIPGRLCEKAHFKACFPLHNGNALKLSWRIKANSFMKMEHRELEISSIHVWCDVDSTTLQSLPQSKETQKSSSIVYIRTVTTVETVLQPFDFSLKHMWLWNNKLSSLQYYKISLFHQILVERWPYIVPTLLN